jgi:hypothetical protein
MNIKACPICGRPFSAVDVVLAESDANFQCHHCWNRMQATGSARRSMNGAKKPRIVGPHTGVRAHRNKP